ncbi:MAG: DUF6259 domain-containing protein [Acidobacteriia bacterium]|nr:DUF6259 domain-containing protein [Terriglobia bacterium]
MDGNDELSRRGFLQGGATAAAVGLPRAAAAATPDGETRVSIDDQGVIHVQTKTLQARIEKGYLTSLRSKSSGQECIREFDRGKSDALQLVYPGGESVDVGEQGFGKITVRSVSDSRADFIFHNWHGDGVMSVSADPENGDLLIEPSAFSSRPGVRGCRWLMKGLQPGLKLVAPLYQGVALELEDPLIAKSNWEWPMDWAAGLAILQGRSSGCWVHARDTRYRYKRLQIGLSDDARGLGFDTEAYGPIDNNLASGGLVWRLNVFDGDWRVPAAQYRSWLWQAFGLSAAERQREEWVHQLEMAISWCPGSIDILEAIAGRADPRKVVLHFSNWRTDAYDENYPTYIASDPARKFIARAHELGFHVMPHFNSMETDPNNPVYTALRDFGYRDVETKRLQGWSWVNRRAIGVPESNASRLEFRDKKVMVKIHPGLAMWRSTLCDRIAEAKRQLALREVFVDVAFITRNLHNALVENMTSTEGMNCLLHEVGEIGDGLAVGAEGLNEINFQALSVAQVHLFKSGQENIEGLERTGGCPLNNFLFGKLTRSFGYSGLSGKTPQEELRARIHDEHETLATITVRSASEITSPTPTVKRALDRAK